MASGIKAFSNPGYDYYELQQDLAGLVPAGAIFVHDTDDHENGSAANGCLKLCWTPEGSCYMGAKGSLCGGTIIFHAAFKDTELFKRVSFGKQEVRCILDLVASLESGLDMIKKKIKSL